MDGQAQGGGRRCDCRAGLLKLDDSVSGLVLGALGRLAVAVLAHHQPAVLASEVGEVVVAELALLHSLLLLGI